MENSASFAEPGSAPLRQKIPTLHHPEGIEPDRIFFHEAQVRELILEYQREGNPETWQAIVMACLPLIESLIRSHNFQLYEDKDVLKNECVIKLFKTIRHYNPARGRAFSCLSVAITRFLISYVQTVRIRAKRMSAVPDEVLEQYESAGQARAELPEELKSKIQGLRTRFKSQPGQGAVKLLINCFLLEGFSQPRKLVLETIRRQFDFSLEKAASLYDYALITVTFPSKSALEKMRKRQGFLDRLGEAEAAFSPGPLSATGEQELLGAVLEEQHVETSLYASSNR